MTTVPVSAIVRAIERILLTLWVGGLWVTGLVLAPVLFASYPRLVAGDIAGRMFTAVSLLGLVCATLLLGFAMARSGRRLWRDWRVAVLAVMLMITVVGEFGLAARMRLLRQAAVMHAPGTEVWTEFGRLHGIANAMFLVNAVTGLVLVAAGPRPRIQAGN
jgi:hypothetical protein